MIDHLSNACFLSIYKTRAYIDTKSPSLQELMSNLPAMKEDAITKKRLGKGKEKDKELSF